MQNVQVITDNFEYLAFNTMQVVSLIENVDTRLASRFGQLSQQLKSLKDEADQNNSLTKQTFIKQEEFLSLKMRDDLSNLKTEMLD